MDKQEEIAIAEREMQTEKVEEKTVKTASVVNFSAKNEEKLQEKEELVSPSNSSYQTEYLQSLENKTIADFKKEEEAKDLKNFEIEKEKLIQKSFEKVETTPEEKSKTQVEKTRKIIEKPNFDLIETNEKVLKISKKEQKKRTQKPKKLSLILSIALAIASVICIGNVIAIDSLQSDLSAIETELYEVNLPKYLKNISDLDSAKKGLDFVETYPEEEYDVGEVGSSTNWFDKICEFLSGIFGG